MPSCSSKFTILRENQISDYVDKFVHFKKAVFHLLVAATVTSCFLFFLRTVTTSKVFRCCGKRNFLFTQNNFFCKTQQKSIYYILCKKKLVKNLAFSKRKLRHFRDIISCTHNTVLFEVFKQNVICFVVLFWLKLLSYSFLLNQPESVKNLNKELIQLYFINISFENNFNSVMEVDETVIGIKPLVNSLPNGDKIKEQICSDEMVANGEIITNCHNTCSDKESKKSVDLIDVSQTDIKLNLAKEIHNGSNEEVVANAIKRENKDIIPVEVINNKKVKIEENLKSFDSRQNESNPEKDKSKEKNLSVNNNSLNHVLSSSSSKKHDSQSRSHHSSSSSSSSSSRHKYKDSRDDKHKISSSSSSNKNNDLSSSSRKDEDKHKSDSRSKSRSCHHKSDEKCHCKSHHRSHHHSKKSKKYQSVKTQCTADEIAFELRQVKFDPSNPNFTRVPWVPHPQLTGLKYGRYYRIEVDRNGGASICHLYMDEISHLPEAQLQECAVEFIKLSYSEDENECAHHVMGIVHGAASYLPDLVDYMADHYPTLTVKTGSLASRDNHTTTMSQYRDEVYKTYSNGTFRYAPLDQLSICGVLGEEVGAYFPDFVARLEQSPFMKPVMPWSSLSVVQTDNPRESNDGPIFWVRPGEQMLPANEALKESARPKKRRNNELDNLVYMGGSRSSEARESLFQDRTKAHADQVGVDYGISNTAPTAAVGVLKAVNCGHPEHGNRATKDVVAFHAQDYTELLEILMLDLYEPPQTQCTKWIEVSKLNTLRREGIRYAHLQLHDNDVYYLPRKIIHQFQTISSVASVAWHIRYRDYFSILGAPNLHTPTGINKGQVFYEKKNVAVYCPPVCENDLLEAVASLEPGIKTPKKSDRLREYSPFKQFKHSPRKLHKHYIAKKEKLLEPVPPVVSVKTEVEAQNVDQEKKNSSSSKKRERSKSDDGRSSTDHGIKREHDSESRKKSESSHSRRHSGDHAPSKKERKDSHSSHRKDVKNLESEFSSKKDKSKRDRSPKSKHEKRSEESKHNGSSKRRHEESSKSRSSKHEKSESGSKHEKRVENGSIVSNGDSSLEVKTEEKNEKENNLKRKHEGSPSDTSVKKIKEKTPVPLVIENGSVSTEPEEVQETCSDSQLKEGLKMDTNNVVGSQLKEELKMDTNNVVGSQLKEELKMDTNNVVGNQLKEELKTDTNNVFGSQLKEELKTDTNNIVGSQLNEELKIDTNNVVGSQLNEDLKLNTNNVVGNQLNEELKLNTNNVGGSQLNEELKIGTNNVTGSQLKEELKMDTNNVIGSQLKEELKLDTNKVVDSQLKEELKMDTDSVVVLERRKIPEEIECIIISDDSQSNETELKNTKKEIPTIFINSESNSPSSQNGTLEKIDDFDLRQHVLNKEFINEVPRFSILPPLLDMAPTPPISHSTKPPLLPRSPGVNSTSEIFILNPNDSDSLKNDLPMPPTQTNSQDGVSSKEKSDTPVKKIKKKVVRKENESYDLLGDIMSKMDKNI